MSRKRTGWPAWCGTGEQAQPLHGSQKKAVGLVSGHHVLLSDPGQVTLLPCWPACVVAMSLSADLTALIKAAWVVAEKGACLLSSACGLVVCGKGLAG